MDEHTLKTEKITKPIQLLGAWLAGLLSIDSCFLFAAAKMPSESWESGALTVAAIVNVPVFLLAVFLLQTRFRPELQEDSYYSTYLSKKTNELISVSKEDGLIGQLRQRVLELESKIASPEQDHDVVNLPVLAGFRIGINKHLADKSLIGLRLSELGVSRFSIFGVDGPPSGRVVAVSEYLPKERVNGVLRIAKELGFTGYTFFDNRAEETEEDILFGSYGSAQHEIASFAYP